MNFNEFRKRAKVKFSVNENRFVISKLEKIPKPSEKIFAIIRDKNDITAVYQEGSDLRSVSEEKFFRLITFDVKFPFVLSGFFSYISNLLAKENIPIFVISAYSTDHILFKEENLDKIVQILKKNRMVQY
jgi:uncharacterized protein